MSDRNEAVAVTYHAVVNETDRALFLKIEAGALGRKVWIPKSQIVDRDDENVLVPRWLAEEKDLDFIG